LTLNLGAYDMPLTEAEAKACLEMATENDKEAEAGGAAWERALLTNPDLLTQVQSLSPADRKLVNQAFCLGWFLSMRHRA
jgi:hypothetical protein